MSAPWNHGPPVELPNSNARTFFEEAKLGAAEEAEARRRFDAFSTKGTKDKLGDAEDDFLSVDGFCKLVMKTDITDLDKVEPFFYAMDRDRDGKLSFAEAWLGFSAADPQTVHILNSYTGAERSQYIFDFYDLNRSGALEWEEFVRLAADCLLSGVQGAPTDPKVAELQAIEKARELNLPEFSKGGTGALLYQTFFELIQGERLRGTSRLFRFRATIIKTYTSRSRRSQDPRGYVSTGSTATTSYAPSLLDDFDDGPPSDREDCEWHAHLMDLDQCFDPDGDEPGPPQPFVQAPAPYSSMLPPAPAPQRFPDPDPALVGDARACARQVLRALASPGFESLLPSNVGGAPPSPSAPAAARPFELLSSGQLRGLCAAAVRLFESEDMILSALQPPVKVFGALHGQLHDLLSHFRWHQLPTEDGDILYTTYLFLGDYCDRGSFSLEVLTLLLSMKVLHPHRVFMLRGQHENRHINFHLGFRAECELRLGPVEGPKVFEDFNRLFEYLSVGALVGGQFSHRTRPSAQVFALGPGQVPRSLLRLDQLALMKKPLGVPHLQTRTAATQGERLSEQLLLELFNPSSVMPGGGPAREASADHISHLCVQSRVAAVIRSRQVPKRGYSFEAAGKLVSLVSCLNYCDVPGGNDASILYITKAEDGNLEVKPQVITARTAKIYGVLGRAAVAPGGAGPPTSLRWPPQPRAATPCRFPRQHAGASLGDVASILAESTSLVIRPDRAVCIHGGPITPFPAFGPGRPASGLASKRAENGQVSWLPLSPFARRGTLDLPCDTSPRASLGTPPSALQGHGHASLGAEPPEVRAMQTLVNVRVDAASAQASEDWAVASAGGESRPAPRTGLAPHRRSSSNAGLPKAPGEPKSRASMPAAKASMDYPLTPSQASTPTRKGPSSHAGTPTSASRVAAVPLSEASATRRAAGSPSSGDGTRRGSGGTSRLGQQRGPSRTPGSTPTATPTAKLGSVSASAAPLSSGSRSGSRRSSSDTGGSRGVEDDQSIGAALDAETWLHLLRRQPRSVELPSHPLRFMHSSKYLPWSLENPVVSHLFQAWLEAGLNDAAWAKAGAEFDKTLHDMRLGRSKAVGADGFDPLAEGCWTVETFSLWFLSQGRMLKECTSWFRAFDFDQDGVISLVDFLQGLVAAAAPNTFEAGSPGSLLTAWAMFRLLGLDSDRRPHLDLEELDSQVALAPQDQARLTAPFLEQARDFTFFRLHLLPMLQSAGFFRLRWLAPSNGEV